MLVDQFMRGSNFASSSQLRLQNLLVEDIGNVVSLGSWWMLPFNRPRFIGRLLYGRGVLMGVSIPVRHLHFFRLHYFDLWTFLAWPWSFHFGGTPAYLDDLWA